MTLDHGYFRTVLSAVDTESISLEGTDIGAAFEVAMATFEDQDAETGESNRDSRAILLISDGEEVSGDALAAAKQAAEYARIFVIGVGDPRGTAIRYRNRFARGVQLKAVEENHVSRLDEATLQRIAVEGRGGYIRATANNSDVEEIFGLIQQLFAQDVAGDVQHQLANRFQWPLGFAIACFAGEGAWLVLLPWIRPSRGRRRPGPAEGVDYA